MVESGVVWASLRNSLAGIAAAEVSLPAPSRNTLHATDWQNGTVCGKGLEVSSGVYHFGTSKESFILPTLSSFVSGAPSPAGRRPNATICLA